MLFQVAIIQTTPKTKDTEEVETILVEPQWITAKTEAGALFSAMQKFAGKLIDANPEHTKVLVRPF